MSLSPSREHEGAARPQAPVTQYFVPFTVVVGFQELAQPLGLMGAETPISANQTHWGVPKLPGPCWGPGADSEGAQPTLAAGGRDPTSQSVPRPPERFLLIDIRPLHPIGEILGYVVRI